MKSVWWIGAGVGLILAGWLAAIWPVAPARVQAPAQIRWRTRTVPKVVTRWRTRQVVIFNLPAGLAAQDVASYLHYAGVIGNEQEFINRAGDAVTRFQVGTYRFSPGESEDQVISELTSGTG